MGCPYEGDVNPVEVRKYADALLKMGTILLKNLYLNNRA